MLSDHGGPMLNGNEIRITEAYHNYAPPMNVVPTVRKLLRTAPDKYLVGLDCVVLTNLSGQSRRNRLGKVTSRGRRHPKALSLGCYHQEWQGSPPWIELYVDRILDYGRKMPLWIPFFRDHIFAKTLFHEIGHHVHLFIKPEYREKEDVADEWARKFYGHFLRRKHWYLVPIAYLVKLFGKGSDR
jgi:hypothetical protein